MFSKVQENKMRRVRALLACGWLIILVSLFWDPLTPVLTDPGTQASPFRLDPATPVLVQGKPLAQEPYALGARLFWTMLIPLVPIFLMLFGHEAWRRLCPLSFITQIPRYLGRQRHRERLDRRSGRSERVLSLVARGGFLSRNLWYVQFGLLWFALCARILFVNSDRTALALFMLAVVTVALTVSVLWGGKSWCNYFCPIAVVQKIYTEPAGLLESHAHLERRPVSQSMCRTTTEAGDRSSCVGCTTHCPDIDLEGAYWAGIEEPPRRFVYYGFFGLVLGFYSYYYLYAGNWDYYFSGAWTHESAQLDQLFAPGLYLAGEPIAFLPKLVAVPLVLAAFVLAAFLLGVVLERAYGALRAATGHALSRSDLLNHTFSGSAFLSINTFYAFGGRPNLALLPPWGLRLVDLLIVFISTAWLLRALARSHQIYRRESMASGLRKQLQRLDLDFDRILEGRRLEELKPDEIYLLAKTLPGATREQQRRLYANLLRESLLTGRMQDSESLALMREARDQMGISEEEHRQILLEVGIEDASLLDPEAARSRESWLRRENFRAELAALVHAAAAQARGLREQIDAPEGRAQLARLRALYGIDEQEQAALLDELTGEGQLLLARADELLKDLGDLSGVWFRLQHAPAGPRQGLLTALADRIDGRRMVLARHLLGLLVNLGERPEALRLASDMRLLLGARLEGLLDSAGMGQLAAPLREQLLGEAKGPAGPPGVSCTHAAGSAPQLPELLGSLTADSDPLIAALALAALADRDPPAARLRAQMLEASAGTGRPALLEAALAHALATSDGTRAPAADDPLTRLAWLREVPLFGALALETLADLAAGTRARLYQRGEALCREGAPAESAFALRSGSAAVSIHGREINRVEAGGIIGELSIITGRPYSATVTIDAPDALVLVIDRARLADLLERDLTATRALLAQVAGYAQRSAAPLAEAAA